jgi:hypothetical protein
MDRWGLVLPLEAAPAAPARTQKRRRIVTQFRILVAILSVFAVFAGVVRAPAAGLPAYSPPAGAAQEQMKATIRVVGNGATRDITIREIEQLPMVEIEGRATAEEAVSRFQGVLLSDLLKALGGGDAPAVTLRASDGYAEEVPRGDWERWPLVVATRLDGKPLSVRSRGPARLIYPTVIYPELYDHVYVDRSVWLLSEIGW